MTMRSFKIRRAAAAFAAAVLLICPALAADTALVPLGRAVGLRLETGGLLVEGLTAVEGDGVCPAREAGLAAGDMIIAVDGEKTRDLAGFRQALAGTGGESAELEVMRGGVRFTAAVTPVVSESGEYKIGVLARDRVEGIGTLTYYDPKSGICGALGHGISEKGALMPLWRGTVTDAELTGVVEGRVGAPGNLVGSPTEKERGRIFANTVCGVFFLSDGEPGEAVPVCPLSEVRCGEAEILSDVDGAGPKAYTVTIEAVEPEGGSRSFVLKVTDPDLLKITGGIVQGMSGSPILQGGRLVGAVTHVLIGDPKTGYGIGIEDMIKEGAAMRQPQKSVFVYT